MPETGLLIQLLLILMAIGALAGVLAGLLGVGGGIVLVAAFYYSFQALGYDGPQLMQICLATSLATIIVTSARSVHGHNKKGAVDWQVLKTWAPGIAVGAVLGVLVAASLKNDTLQAIFGVLAIVVSMYMAFGRTHWRLGEQMPTGGARAAFSPAVGFLSVLMGIGGGSFGVPLMTLYGMPIHRAVATASGFGLLIAVPSVVGFLFVSIDPAFRPPWTLGAVNLPAFLVVICMTLLTTPVGVKLAHRMNPAPLKRVFAGFLFLVALNMLRSAIWG
ncbi:sulfite exporter TauE/SafE family protein [Pseudoruegeria sp. HB172150]|uniref:sulfite exporter TauE/SafE family protein n=1 Tax=Pseudoruegeria sp. HB172150 TaxID=2721164 RepID=UPI0015561AF5|nr:sulfite exporter TauE/SafE family protein [Pseudoruegeria sp. HB172150]